MESHASMEQQFLKKLVDVINTNMHHEHFGVTELAEQLGMSRYTLHRKVKSIVKKSVSEFIRDERLKRAHELLQQKTGTVSEIAFKVGFGSVSYFNRCFNERYGFPPGEVLKGLHPVEDKTKWESRSSAFEKLQANKKLYFLPLILLVALLAYFIFQEQKTKNIEKTIAVLPPKDISPKNDECVVLEGIREDLMSKLFSLAGLEVVSGTTTDTYRNSEKKLKQIAKELHVNYVLEIRGQTIAGNTTVWVQLIEAATDKHIWANSYDNELKGEKIQEAIEEIALVVAKELDVTLTSEEKRQLVKRFTSNDAAYYNYLQGLNHLKINNPSVRNPDFVYSAQKFFRNALVLDSGFAEAYYQLAYVYIHQLPFINNNDIFGLYNAYLDSGLVLANKALELGISDKYKVFQLKADYYQRVGRYEEALENFEKVWERKKKDYSYFLYKAYYNHWIHYNSETARNFFLYLKLKPDTVLLDKPILLRMVYCFSNTGFPEMAKFCADEYLRQTNDSLQHLFSLSVVDFHEFKFEEHITKVKRLFEIDSTNFQYSNSIRFAYYHLRSIDSAYFWSRRIEQIAASENEELIPNIVVGNIYQLKGYHTEAEANINAALDNCLETINSNIRFAQNKYAYGLLAGIYSLKGEKSKALLYLSLMEEEKKVVGRILIKQLETMPMYDNIRSEPEFDEVLIKLRAKYREDHERVRKIIIQNGRVPA